MLLGTDMAEQALPDLVNTLNPGSTLMKIWPIHPKDVAAKDLIVATTKRVPEMYYPKRQLGYVAVLLRHIFPRALTWAGVPTL